MALLVGVGGSGGALARYYVTIGMTRLLGPEWPVGTLTANLLGSFAIGVLAAMAARNQLPPFVQASAMVGFLGAFTTFSTFSLEAVSLFRAVDGAGPSALYVGVSVVFGVVLAGAGFWAASQMPG
jgi:CrcB protein